MKRNHINLPSWLIGILITIIISAFVLFLTPVMVLGGYISMNAMQYVFIITQGLAVMIGAFIAGKRSSVNKLAICTLVGGIYWLILLSISIVFLDGTSVLAWGSLGSCMIGAICASYAVIKGNNRPKRRGRG